MMCELCGYSTRRQKYYSLSDHKKTGRGSHLHKECCRRLLILRAERLDTAKLLELLNRPTPLPTRKPVPRLPPPVPEVAS